MTGAVFLLDVAATRGERDKGSKVLYRVGASQARGPGLGGRH